MAFGCMLDNSHCRPPPAPLNNQSGITSWERKNLLWVRFWLSCNKDSCRTFPGTTLYIVRCYWMKCNRRQTQNSCLASGLNSFNFQGQRKRWCSLTVTDAWASPQVTFAVLYRLRQPLFFTVSAYRSCFGVPRLCLGSLLQQAHGAQGQKWSCGQLLSFIWRTHWMCKQTRGMNQQLESRVTLVVCETCCWSVAGFPRGSWVHLSHLVGREGCPHTLWQSGGRTPKRRWSSWDGCSGLQKNFSEVTPKTTINEED